MAKKRRVLFICTHNSSRSQMAEAFLNTLYGKRFEAASAGTEPSQVNPYAIEVMREENIDLTHHRSKSTDKFRGVEFDYVITVCDRAYEACPLFSSGDKQLHKSFEDPTRGKGADEEKRSLFRKVRDEIKEWIIETFGEGND